MFNMSGSLGGFSDFLSNKVLPVAQTWSQFDLERKNAKTQNELNLIKAQTEQARVQAEAAANERAMLAQFDLTETFKKWGNYIIGTVGFLAAILSISSFLKSRKGKRK